MLDTLHNSINPKIHSATIPVYQKGVLLCKQHPPTTQPNTTTGKLLFQTKLALDNGAIVRFDAPGKQFFDTLRRNFT